MSLGAQDYGDDIASGTLQPLLKIVNGHLRSWDQASGSRNFHEIEDGGPQQIPTGQLAKPTKILGFFLQNKHNFGCLS